MHDVRELKRKITFKKQAMSVAHVLNWTKNNFMMNQLICVYHSKLYLNTSSQRVALRGKSLSLLNFSTLHAAHQYQSYRPLATKFCTTQATKDGGTIIFRQK